MIRFMKWGSIETTNQPRSAASLDWANRKRLYLSVPLFRNKRFMFDKNDLAKCFKICLKAFIWAEEIFY